MREILSTLALLGLLLGWAVGLLVIVTSIPVITEKFRKIVRPPDRPKVAGPKAVGPKAPRKAHV